MSPRTLDLPPIALVLAVAAPILALALRPRLPASTPRVGAVVERRAHAAAWGSLSAAVRWRFGGYDAWRARYRATLSGRPLDIEVRRGPDGSAAVTHELAAADRTPCGPAHRRFAVRWRLVAGERGWRAAEVSAVKLSGAEPATACAGRHDPPRERRGR
jgi:hypothetical protein